MKTNHFISGLFQFNKIILNYTDDMGKLQKIITTEIKIKAKEEKKKRQKHTF